MVAVLDSNPDFVAVANNCVGICRGLFVVFLSHHVRVLVVPVVGMSVDIEAVAVVVDFVDMPVGMGFVRDMSFVVVPESASALQAVHLVQIACSIVIQCPLVAALEHNMPSLVGRDVGIVALAEGAVGYFWPP